MTTILFLGEWAARSSILILAGALLLRLLRVKNPSVRLIAWTAMLAGSLAIPVLTTIVPGLPLAVLRVPVQPAAVSAVMGGATPPAIPEPASAATSEVPIVAHLFSWIRLAAGFYFLAAAALLLRLFSGWVASLRIVARSGATGIQAGDCEVRESGHVTSPVTAGILRPVVLLPSDWREWQPAKLTAVLAHEGSHARRHDPAVQWVSAIHRALLWASPLSWLVHRSIVRAGEELSDNDAILASRDRVSYAEILLEFVHRGARETECPGVAMASYDRPEKRIRRILNSAVVPSGVPRWGMAAIVAIAAPLAYLAAAAQPQAAAQPSATFEVASIKPVIPDVPHNMGIQVYPGGRVVLSTFNLKALIAAAFRLSYWQISGGEEWIEKEEYNVEAKPPEAMQARIKDLRHTLFGIENEELRQMLQTLLIERFQLKFHRETKTGDVYLLQQSGKTLRLRPTEIPATDGGDEAGEKRSFGSIGYVDGSWGIFATSMPQLAKFAADFILHVPVLDRTDLKGLFDYRQRQPDIEPKYGGDQSDSFRRALAEVGLKLERAKGPVETFVIDHAAKPLPN